MIVRHDAGGSRHVRWDRRGRLWPLGLALAALVGPGCKHAAAPRGDDSTTLGADFRTAPAGRTIPAAGLGVDLVDSARRDASTVTTAAMNPETPTPRD